MSYKARIISSLVFIIIVYWFDFQFLSQFPHTFPISESIRRTGHLFFLTLVMLAGGFAWAISPTEWIKVIWWYAYLIVLALLFVMGLVAHYVHISMNVLYAFYKLRIFFVSPSPFSILYIFTKIKRV